MFKTLSLGFLCVSVSLWLVPSSHGAEPLPNTKPLTIEGNLSAKQVEGMHKYLDRALAAAPKEREKLWKLDTSSPEAYAKSIAPHRERLKKYLGVVDKRVPPRLEYVSGPGEPSLVAERDGCTIHTVRWAVLPGVDAEGLLIEPKDKPLANVVAIPHTDQTPEQIAYTGAEQDTFALRLAKHGCRVLIPTLIDRKDNLSGSAKLNRATNIPHREFIHRMAFEMGRTLSGYEVQKVLAGVDWFESAKNKLPVGVIGYGDGGMIALYSAALDERIKSCGVSAYFSQRERIAEEPIDRNVWGRVKEFGDAELALLIVPPASSRNGLSSRTLRLDPSAATKVDEKFWPVWSGPKPARGGAAPGKLTEPPQGAVTHEVERWYQYFGGVPVWQAKSKLNPGVSVGGFYKDLLGEKSQEIPAAGQGLVRLDARDRKIDATARHKRQFDQLVAFTQKLWRDSEAVRKAFWKKADAKSPEAWEKSCEWYRDYFHTEVIGKLPEPTMPLNPRSRQVYDEKTWTGYEVMLDVYPDVFAYGILLLPKDLKPGEKRPVVVCQHGLEGTPRSTIEIEKRPVYNHFSRRLVELGYIVYAPQNPYYGQNVFRQLQRKANSLKLSLFSFIIRQHQRTLDWLEKLPNVDPKRIAFYGLSYGGKTAMRVPAVEKRYCLSICSGDFNEWIGKNVSVDLDRSYMWSGEYEMYEFDLGSTFNYAEMAFLIAPRPFMVERGHDDGVGIDEMVAYEFAKVRYLYANRLKLPDRTTIEWFVGHHEIHAKGTFEFLKKHLDYPEQ